ERPAAADRWAERPAAADRWAERAATPRTRPVGRERAYSAVKVSPVATVWAGTTAPASTRQSVSTAYGPTTAPSATLVAPRRCTPGCSVTSRPSRTASSRRSEEHTSELQSRENLVCRLLL